MGFCSFVFNEDSQDTMWTEIHPGANQKTEPRRGRLNLPLRRRTKLQLKQRDDVDGAGCVILRRCAVLCGHLSVFSLRERRRANGDVSETCR